MGRGQGSHVGSLAVVFPGVEDGDRAVGIEFDIAFRSIRAVQAGTVDTQGDTDSAFNGLGGVGSSLLLCGGVFRPQDVEHLRQGIDFRFLTGRGGGPFAIAVFVSQFQRVHTQLLGQFIHQDF